MGLVPPRAVGFKADEALGAVVKILHQDRKQNLIKVRPDVLDDLWHLFHVVKPGDLARAVTFRTPEEAATDKARAGKVEKKPMVLGLRVEKVEFHEFSDRLRILGVIEEGPQDHGMHHTINVEPRLELEIEKPNGWREHELERLKEAVEAAEQPLVTFVAIEENEAVVAVLRQYGVQKMADILGHTSGKMYKGDKGAEEDFFDEILMALRDYRSEGSPLILLGPGFAKDRFLDYAKQKQPEAVKGVALEPTGQAGMPGVQEALRRGVVDRVAKENRVAKETRAVEDLLTALATEKPATYGRRHVEHALNLGAAERLLVTDEALREDGGALLDLAKVTGADSLVVSTLHEAGQKLQNLGGVGAILRYETPPPPPEA